MKIKRVLPALSLTLIAGALAACSAGETGKTEDVTRVVASFYPAEFLAKRIGGDLVSVQTLTSPGAEAHDLELTAKQVVSLNEAKVLVYLADFQAAVDDAVEKADRTQGSTVDIGAHVADLEDSHEHDDGHDHDEGHDHEHDPHVWLDPQNMIVAANDVLAALVWANPAAETELKQNAEVLISELGDLDSKFQAGLVDASCERREFITSHAAFGHLAHAYDLVQVPISGLDPHSEPSVAALAEISDHVREEGFTTVFTEPLTSPNLAKTIARQTGAKTAVLDPIEGLTKQTADQDYVSLMEQNLAALKLANGCQ